MVRGNWQKRVETAQARKDATKQRKQRRNQKENAKNQVIRFLTDLDKVTVLSDLMSSDFKIHIWTDSCPKNVDEKRYEPLINQRVNTFSSPNSKPTNRSEGGGSGKKHPRTRANSITNQDEKYSNQDDVTSYPLYCRNHFFYGSCNGTIRKKGKGLKKSCQFLHFQQDPCYTLAEILLNKKTSSIDDDLSDVLMASADAVISSSSLSSYSTASPHTPKDQIGMPINYHLPVSFSDTVIASLFADANPPTAVSNVITATLNQQKCSISNVNYIAVNGYLLYDRFKGGSLHSLEALQTIPFDSSPRSRSDSISANLDHLGAIDNLNNISNKNNERTPKKERGIQLFDKLPATILDEIITFLPDIYAAYLPQVCKNWRAEIGITSPYLWNHLLLRNGWPLPTLPKISLQSSPSSSSLHAMHSPMSSPLHKHLSPNINQHGQSSEEEKNPSESEVSRNSYLSHYQMCRDLRAIQTNIRQFTNFHDRKASITENSKHIAAVQSFKSTRDSPDFTNGCVALKMFDHTRVLAAYSPDGTLRLFEASAGPKSSSVGSGVSGNVKLSCRQVVCIKAVPKKIKKSHFRLVSMDLDDTNVACLCEVDYIDYNNSQGIINDDEDSDDGNQHGGNVSRIESLLTIVSREDLLCAAGGREFELENEDSLMIVNVQDVALDFLQEMEENFQHDQFLDETSLPSFDRKDIKVKVSGDIIACRGGHFCFEISIIRHIDFMPIVVDHKICLFSKSANKIIWMQDFNADLWSNQNLPSFLTLASSTASNWSSNGTQRRRQPTSVVLASNDFPHIYLLEVHRRGKSSQAALIENSDISRIQLEAEGWSILSRNVVVLASSIVVAGDTFRRVDGDENLNVSVLFFYPTKNEKNSSPKSLKLKDNCKIIFLESIGETYVLVICKCTRGEEAEYGGQWFVPDDSQEQIIQARIVHVPSCREIDCVDLMPCSSDFFQHGERFPFVMTGSQSCLAMALSWHGMILTGISVKEVFMDAVKKASVGEGDKKHTKKKKTSLHRSKLAQHRNKDRKKDGFARGMNMRG